MKLSNYKELFEVIRDGDFEYLTKVSDCIANALVYFDSIDLYEEIEKNREYISAIITKPDYIELFDRWNVAISVCPNPKLSFIKIQNQIIFPMLYQVSYQPPRS